MNTKNSFNLDSFRNSIDLNTDNHLSRHLLNRVSTQKNKGNFQATPNNTSSVIKTLETNFTSSINNDSNSKNKCNLKEEKSITHITKPLNSSVKMPQLQRTFVNVNKSTSQIQKLKKEETVFIDPANTDKYVKSKSSELRKMYSNYLEIKKKSQVKKKVDIDSIVSKRDTGLSRTFIVNDFSYKFLAKCPVSSTNYWFQAKDYNNASYGIKTDGIVFSYGVNSHKGLFK